MRRKLTTLRAKMGHSQNGSDRTLVDIARYREHRNHANWQAGVHSFPPQWDSQYAGWSWATRPKDSPIFLRPIHPVNDG